MSTETINNNDPYGLPPSTGATPTTDTVKADPPPPKVHMSYLYALEEALSNMCDASYSLQASDAQVTLMAQNHMELQTDQAADWESNYMAHHDMSKPEYQTQLSTAQTTLSAYTNEMDGTVHGLESTLESENNRLQGFTDQTSVLHTIMSETSSLIAH